MDIFNSKKISHARKNYVCDWCGESITKDSSYHRYRWSDGRDVGTCIMHTECHRDMQSDASDVDADEYFTPYEHPRGKSL